MSVTVYRRDIERMEAEAIDANTDEQLRQHRELQRARLAEIETEKAEARATARVQLAIDLPKLTAGYLEARNALELALPKIIELAEQERHYRDSYVATHRMAQNADVSDLEVRIPAIDLTPFQRLLQIAASPA